MRSATLQVCFMSNGYGEDHAGAVVAAALRDVRPRVDVLAAPFVTDGAAYRERGIAVAVPGASPASGGFPFTNLTTFVRDLGAWPDYVRYVSRLRRLAAAAPCAVAVGDTFLLSLARAAVPQDRVAHVAVAKSVHGRRHSTLECALLRRWTRLVLARDEKTAADLVARGVRAEFCGNPLVEGFRAAAPGRHARPTVLLLPGSRREACRNFVALLSVAESVRADADWVCAWPGHLDVAKALGAAVERGWAVDRHAVGRHGVRVQLRPGAFADVLPDADLVVGLAGTANEQAAALGIPVVTFAGAGPQTTLARMQEQACLLGGAAECVPGGPVEAARLVERLVRDPVERTRRGQCGRDRLGPQGAGGRIAARLAQEFGW